MNYIDLDFDIIYNIMFRKNPDCDDCDTQYRRELLNFFRLGQYDDTKISIRTDKLYHELVKYDQFVILFTLILNEPMLTYISGGTEISAACLSMLCSFNYFHLLFKSIKEIKQSDVISDETFTEFRNEITRNIN